MMDHHFCQHRASACLLIFTAFSENYTLHTSTPTALVFVVFVFLFVLDISISLAASSYQADIPLPRLSRLLYFYCGLLLWNKIDLYGKVTVETVSVSPDIRRGTANCDPSSTFEPAHNMVLPVLHRSLVRPRWKQAVATHLPLSSFVDDAQYYSTSRSRLVKKKPTSGTGLADPLPPSAASYSIHDLYHSNMIGRIRTSGGRLPELRDRAGVTIVVPGRVRRVTRTIKGSNEDDDNRDDGTTTTTWITVTALPQLHLMAWLDARQYFQSCRKSSANSSAAPSDLGATTWSGTAAAQLLQRGRQDLVRLLRTHVHRTSGIASTATTKPETAATPGSILTVHAPSASSPVLSSSAVSSSSLPPSSPNRPRRRPLQYVLHGHGIPLQLLQYCIDFAQQVLSHNDDNDETLYCTLTSVPQAPTTAAVDWTRTTWVRRLRRRHESGLEESSTTTTLRIQPPLWSSENNSIAEFQEHDWLLYWTVMQRLAWHLSVVLPPPRDESAIRLDAQGLLAEPALRLHQWKASFCRGLLVDPSLLPIPPMESSTTESSTPRPVLIVEWNPRTEVPPSLPLSGVWSPPPPGHVAIRLQGAPSSRKRPVTLCFDAAFGYQNEA
jgi:hypothetical protein